MNNNKFVLIVAAILLSFCFISFMQNINYENQHRYEIVEIDETSLNEINNAIRSYSNENGIILDDHKFVPTQSVQDENSITYKVNCTTKNMGVVTFEVVCTEEGHEASILS